MTLPDLPDDVRRFVHDCVPTLEALEILLMLTREPGRVWQPDAMLRLLQPGTAAVGNVREYLDVLAGRGIVTREAGGFVYRPATAALTRAVEGVIIAYHQRPVTLIRTVYEGADLRNIRTFADAFRLRKRD